MRRPSFAAALLAALLLAGCAGESREGREPALFGTAMPRNLESYLSELRECCGTGAYAIATGEIPGHPMTSWENSEQYSVIYADDDYVSYQVLDYIYTGGAHGSTIAGVGTLERATGRELTLDDVCREEERPALLRRLRELVVQAVGGEENLLGEPTITENFYLDARGWNFVYQQYEVACYATGIVTVTVPGRPISGPEKAPRP